MDKPRAEEHPGLVSSSELARLVADSPAFEALSLTDPPLTPQTTDAEEISDDDDQVSPERVTSGFGFPILGPQTLRYSAHPPRPKWSGGVLGQGMLEKHAADANSSELDQSITDLSRSEALSVTVSSFSRSDKSTDDSDNDTEKELRLLEEYYDAHPPISISQAFQFLADQAQQKASAVAHTQHSTVPRKLRHEASDEEIVENAKNWMRDEVTLVFQNYIGRRRGDLKIVDYHIDELCHQCFSVEDYHSIFHHYNFTVKLKKVNSDDWVSALYFAEVKQMFGIKSDFCCRLEPDENGLCYACRNQGVDDLRHPVTGGFTDVGSGLCYPDEL